jgi:hypothetical protein
MQTRSNSPDTVKAALKRLIIVVLFGIAFGYIEAAVVVYLRAIFYPAGFAFPLTDFGTGALWRQLLLTEIGREAATMVVIFTSCWLFGRNRRHRFAYFMVIFAVWDIFYYIWLKALINWPASIMDWDILFLIPLAWTSPVLAPVLVSLTLLIFAVVMLYCDLRGKTIETKLMDWAGFILAGLAVVASFCIAGLHMAEPDFQAWFYWPLFAGGLLLAVGLFIKCLLRSNEPGSS